MEGGACRPERKPMTLAKFHNALRIMLNIDMHDLVEVGIIGRDDHETWMVFRQDPYRWMIHASDARAEKLWTLIEARNLRVDISGA
jgi:hypothetical protein